MTKENTDSNHQKIKHLKWKTRRGMLELDVLLERYLLEDFENAPEAEQRLFEALLEEDDPVLFAWFMGNEIPRVPQIKALVNKIRRV